MQSKNMCVYDHLKLKASLEKIGYYIKIFLNLLLFGTRKNINFHKFMRFFNVDS